MKKTRARLHKPRSKLRATVIGITGESGSGKTEICDFLASRLPNCRVLHAGACRRTVFGRHREELIAEYGASVLTPENRISHEFILNNPHQYAIIKQRYEEEFVNELASTIEEEAKNCQYLVVERTGLPRLTLVWNLFDVKILMQCPETKRNAFRLARWDHKYHKSKDLKLRDELAFSGYDKYRYDLILHNEHALGELFELGKIVVNFLMRKNVKIKDNIVVKRKRKNPSGKKELNLYFR